MFGPNDPLALSLAFRIEQGYKAIYGNDASDVTTEGWHGAASNEEDTLWELMELYEDVSGEVHPLDSMISL